jgi:hypothetical protein
MQKSIASTRADDSQHSFLAVFGHGFITYWTRNHNLKTRCTNLIKHTGIARASTTDFASNTDAVCVGFESGCTGNASSIAGYFARSGKRGRWLATFGTGGAKAVVTRPTDAIVGNLSADYASKRMIIHTYNLPQLAYRVKFALQRLADMGLEPRLVS